MRIDSLTHEWLGLLEKRFSRKALVDANGIQCDCSGLINLLCEQLSIPKPYGLANPRAVHYFAILQEIGSSHISQIKPGHLMAWRKDTVPKSGDSGHVLLADSLPVQIVQNVYRLQVVDSTKLEGGLSQREIELHTSADGRIIGVQLHLSVSKVKHVPIYHAALETSRYCFGCGVPKKICLCGQIAPNLDALPLVLLRHPNERKQTLSTVSLIKQRYPEVLVKEGEIFSPLRFNNMTLVFPATQSEHLTSSTDQSNTDVSVLSIERKGAEPATAIVLDATWRKAKRMLHENPWLAVLPRVSIKPEAMSDYLIRKVPDPESLSTVEVVALLQDDQALQNLFKTFMRRQIELMGQEKYEQNYQSFINYSPNQLNP